MKLLSNYKKEMLIASRGFYFYIEIVIALILLGILLFFVKENPSTKQQEFIYIDTPAEVSALEQVTGYLSSESGTITQEPPQEWKVQPRTFSLTHRDTGELYRYDFKESGTITSQPFTFVDAKKNYEKTIHLMKSREDLYRLSYEEQIMGMIIQRKDQQISYQYILQGYEPDQLTDMLYMVHSKDSFTLGKHMASQPVRSLGASETLNNRENMVPLFLAFAGSLMGLFIVVAYIFLDKEEGVITAFAVSPCTMRTYLLSKILVICTTVLISSSIVTIPIMKGGPNYPLLYTLIITSTFAFGSLGLLVATFFDSMSKSFGALYGIMILLLIPGFTYYIPSFDSRWTQLLPTHHVLQSYKNALLPAGPLTYWWISSGIFLLSGVILLELANYRFKKTITL